MLLWLGWGLQPGCRVPILVVRLRMGVVMRVQCAARIGRSVVVVRTNTGLNLCGRESRSRVGLKLRRREWVIRLWGLLRGRRWGVCVSRRAGWDVIARGRRLMGLLARRLLGVAVVVEGGK